MDEVEFARQTGQEREGAQALLTYVGPEIYARVGICLFIDEAFGLSLAPQAWSERNEYLR